MTVPTPKTWAAGEFVDAAEANAEWRDVFNFLLAAPRCYAYQTASESVADGAWEGLNYGGELYDSHGSHSTSTNNSRLTAQESGTYVVYASIGWNSNSTGDRKLNVRKNSGASQSGGVDLVVATMRAAAGAGTSVVNATFETQLTASDYLEMFGSQTSGGSLSTVAASNSTFLAFRWVAKTSS